MGLEVGQFLYLRGMDSDDLIGCTLLAYVAPGEFLVSLTRGTLVDRSPRKFTSVTRLSAAAILTSAVEY